MRSALIRDGIVANIIMAAEGYDPGEGCTVVPIGSEPVEIGAGWNGSAFTAPAPAAPVLPEAVTARQARLALLAAGKLAHIDTALAGIPGVQGDAARIEWEYATDVRRDSPLIAALAPALGLTAAQVDALFVMAAGL